MKALIISEDENVYTTLDEILKKASYDTIIYKWLLKALDNIEEIQPDLIVVSSSEYPRHWKTLVQFVKSGIGGDDVQIYLYEPTPVSAEDEEKAKILGVTGCFSEFDEFEKMIFRPAQEAKAEIEEPVVEEAPSPSEEPAVTNTGHFMFTHPGSQKFISGKYFDYNGKTLSCTFFDENDLSTIKEEMTVESFSFFDSIKVRTASVIIKNVMSLAPSNTFVIVEIKDIYEEN